MTPHPHDYRARHAHGELDTLVVGAAIIGKFRPAPSPPLAQVIPLPTGRLVILGRDFCDSCGCDHDVYGVCP